MSVQVDMIGHWIIEERPISYEWRRYRVFIRQDVPAVPVTVARGVATIMTPILLRDPKARDAWPSADILARLVAQCRN